MADFRTRNQLLLAVVQAGVNIEGAPVPATDAIKLRQGIQFTPNFDTVETDYAQEGVSASAPVVAGGNAGFRIPGYLRGAGTAGQAADYGRLLRGSGLSETLTAAAVTGTATAAAASTITLAVGSSAVDNAYKGMPIRITGGTGAGLVNLVKSYVGATKVATVAVPWANLPGGVTPDATSQYSIDANALYRPISSGFELLTLWNYQHSSVAGANSRRRRLMDAAGTFSLNVPTRGLATIDFTFGGTLPATPDDVAKPAAATFTAPDPQPFLAAQGFLGGAKVKFSQMTFDLGAAAQAFDDPSATFGYDASGITGRQATGRIVPELIANTTRNPFADWIASTDRDLWLRWGNAAGKRVSLYLPQIRYTGNTGEDVRGYAAEGLPFRSAEADGEIYICLH